MSKRCYRYRFRDLRSLGRLLAAAASLTAFGLAAGSVGESSRQARLMIDAGQFSKALKILDEQSRTGLEEPEILYLRGYVLYRLHKFTEAKPELAKALKSGPWRLRSSYVLGRIAQQEGNQMEAIQRLEACALEKPPVEDSVARIGQLYWNTGQNGKARTWTERAIAATPWDGSLHYRLARIHQQLGEEAPAKREFEESVKAKSADSGGVVALMECSRALATHDMTTALRVRSEFLSNADLDPDLLTALGTAFATSGSIDEAIALFQRAGERDPLSFQAKFNLGLALLNVNRPQEAISPLSESVQLSPESKQANAALALVYVAQGKFREAVAPLEFARQADPDDRKIAGLLSVAYLRTGSAAKAVPILRALIGAGSDDPKLYFLLVECLNASEKQQDALMVAGEAVALFPGLAKSWLSKGQQLARLGQYHEAGPSFAKAVELAPDQVEPLLGLAEAQFKDGDYQRALETYERAVAKNADVTAVLGAAKSLIFLGRVPQARTLLEQLAAKSEASSEVHVELSRVYARLGETGLAREQTEIAQRLREGENLKAHSPQ